MEGVKINLWMGQVYKCLSHMNTNCFWPSFQNLFLCYYVVEFEAFSLSRIHLGFLGEQNSELSEHVGTCFPGGTSDKEPACQCRRHKEADSITALGRSPGGRHGNPLQYSYLECSVDRGAWRATVHRVTTIQTQLKQLSTLTHNEYYSSYDAICIYIFT